MKIYRTLRYYERSLEKGIRQAINAKKFEPGAKLISGYKNKFSGRCFIIGNGPSLTIGDLNTLKAHNEVCIASNSIYNLYDKTEWRPTIYTVHDFQEIKRTAKIISTLTPELKIAAQSASGRIHEIDGAVTIRLIDPDTKHGAVNFSDDIAKCVYDGGTVTYVSIQSACYLGFKEIILLGVDHSFAREKRKDGTVEIHSNIQNHFEDYQSDSFWGNGMKDEDYVVFPLDFATMAFEKAREYADGHGIKIYNATRGGKLEVFERVNFDELFQEEK